MKKIFMGILFRFFRSIETWGLVALLLFATVYTGYVELKNTENSYILETDLARYEDLDVSSYDVYRMHAETLPEDTYNKMTDEVSCAVDESHFVFSILNDIPLVPAILLAVFIPVFFGRLFSDGTIKNLISSGHSRGKIYLVSLLFCFILNFATLLVSAAVYSVWCLVLKWHPPIYLPVMLVTLFIDLLLSFTFSSWCLSVLFMSKKKTLAFITSFLLSVSLFVYPATIPVTVLGLTQKINVDDEEIKLLRTASDEAPYALEEHFDLGQFTIEYRYQGEKYRFVMDSSLPDGIRFTCLLMIYSDPELIMHYGDMMTSIPPYVFLRDGLMTINIASNIFWIAAGNALGVFVFRKREIK